MNQALHWLVALGLAGVAVYSATTGDYAHALGYLLAAASALGLRVDWLKAAPQP